MRSSLIPQCTECMRNYAFGFLRETRIALGSIEHVRGKKKSVRGPLSMPVRLLKDQEGFGAAGTIVPVAIGRMRNHFFPGGIAEYVTMDEKRQLKRSHTLIERDFTFGTEVEEDTIIEEEPEPEAEPVFKPRRIEVQNLTPERGMQLLEIFVPQRLDFYRQAILEPEPEETPRAGLTGVAMDYLELRAEAVRQADKEARSKREQSIYGSVSTHDVYEAVKAAMAVNEESSRVVLDEGAISFTSTDVEADDASKLKQTGTFNYSIKLKGAETAISRTVKVIAQRA